LNCLRAYVLIIAIFMSIYSNYLNSFSISFIGFLIGSIISFILFILKKNIWVYIFSGFLVLNIFDIIEFHFYSSYIGINGPRINMIPTLFLFLHIGINSGNKNKSYEGNYFSIFYKSEKSKLNKFQSKVSRFEFKYRDKSKQELEDIIENNDVMTKGAVQAASNLLENFDLISIQTKYM